MKSDLQTFLDMLESSGYSEGTNEDDLGHREYIKLNAGVQTGVKLGSGRTGDGGCYTIFYFRHNGEFTEHNANVQD